jgi:hypothetical protein
VYKKFLKISAFWGRMCVIHCSRAEVSGEHAASIIRVTPSSTLIREWQFALKRQHASTTLHGTTHNSAVIFRETTMKNSNLRRN